MKRSNDIYKSRYEYLLAGKVEFVSSAYTDYQICASINKGEFKLYRTQAEFNAAIDFEILNEKALLS